MSFSGDLYPTAGATSVMTTKGDIVDYDTQRQRLGIGSANQVLQVTAGGLPAWQTLSAGATVTQSSIEDYSSGQTTTSTSAVILSGGTSVTLTSSGSCIIVHSAMQENNTAGLWTACLIFVNGSAVGKAGVGATDTAGYQRQICVSYSMANGGEAVNAGWYVAGGTGTLTNGGGVDLGCRTSVLEVS